MAFRRIVKVRHQQHLLKPGVVVLSEIADEVIGIERRHGFVRIIRFLAISFTADFISSTLRVMTGFALRGKLAATLAKVVDWGM